MALKPKKTIATLKVSGGLLSREAVDNFRKRMDKMEENPAKIIADELKKISEGMHTLLAGGLKKKAIIVLLHSKTGMAQRDIECVVDGIADLAADWTQ